MITDKEARELIVYLRKIAKYDREQSHQAHSAIRRWRCEGRAEAYWLVARYLENLMTDSLRTDKERTK